MSNSPASSASSATSYGDEFYQLPRLSPPPTQKAVVTFQVTSTLNLAVATIPVRQPLPTEIIVRVCYSGICRSDATFSKGPLPGYPSVDHIAGHEGIGQIVKTCDSGLLGRFVGLRYLGSTCRYCEYCLACIPTSCPHQKNAPKQLSGCFQEYLTVETKSVLLIPDGIISRVKQPEILCGALCSGAAALMALRAANLAINKVVVIIGVAGSIGNYTASMAKRIFGAQVIGVDVAWKVEELRRRGFNDYADILLAGPSDEGDNNASDLLKNEILRACGKLRHQHAMTRAADAVIVTASSAAAFQRVESYVCDGGWIVCSGVPYGMQLSISIHDLVERNIHVTGSLMGGPSISLEVMRYICNGQILPMTSFVSLEEIPEQLELIVEGKTFGKVIAKIQQPIDAPFMKQR